MRPLCVWSRTTIRIYVSSYLLPRISIKLLPTCFLFSPPLSDITHLENGVFLVFCGSETDLVTMPFDTISNFWFQPKRTNITSCTNFSRDNCKDLLMVLIYYNLVITGHKSFKDSVNTSNFDCKKHSDAFYCHGARARIRYKVMYSLTFEP